MKLPHWVTDPNLTDKERERALINYQLRLAALHNHPGGAISRLGLDAGFSIMYMRNTIARGTLSKRVRMAIQGLVGPEVFETTDTSTDL
jgi:hypothetical protein